MMTALGGRHHYLHFIEKKSYKGEVICPRAQEKMIKQGLSPSSMTQEPTFLTSFAHVICDAVYWADVSLQDKLVIES